MLPKVYVTSTGGAVCECAENVPEYTGTGVDGVATDMSREAPKTFEGWPNAEFVKVEATKPPPALNEPNTDIISGFPECMTVPTNTSYL